MVADWLVDKKGRVVASSAQQLLHLPHDVQYQLTSRQLPARRVALPRPQRQHLLPTWHAVSSTKERACEWCQAEGVGKLPLHLVQVTGGLVEQRPGGLACEGLGDHGRGLAGLTIRFWGWRALPGACAAAAVQEGGLVGGGGARLGGSEEGSAQLGGLCPQCQGSQHTTPVHNATGRHHRHPYSSTHSASQRQRAHHAELIVVSR
mmetsp:Transcript_36314/g.80820  ORF Transcript_36314/g.80820 Transcript_36314/m.80820 type:complete len:205 (-) Transcript_36314:1001-1615(-)